MILVFVVLFGCIRGSAVFMHDFNLENTAWKWKQTRAQDQNIVTAILFPRIKVFAYECIIKNGFNFESWPKICASIWKDLVLF